MATAAVIDLGNMISTSPDFREGRPFVTGTGVTVMRLAGWYRLGHTPEAISRKTGLSLAQIYAALTYYHLNQAAVDDDLDREAAEYDRLSLDLTLERRKKNEASPAQP
jgi:uncharacterized protein (DUF433 family)